MRPSEAGFVARLLTAWMDLRVSMRSILDSEPGEGRILMFAMTHGVIVFAAYVLGVAAEAAPLPGDDMRLDAKVAAGFTAYIILRPLLLYAIAAGFRLALKGFGGTASWRESRAAVCWAAVVSAPVSFVLALPGIFALVPGSVVMALDAIAASFFVVALSYFITEANGLRRVWPVFLVVGGATMGVFGAVYAGSASAMPVFGDSL